MPTPAEYTPERLQQLAEDIKAWGKALGFADIGITDINLTKYENDYFNWLEQGFHGEMDYMAKHGTKRTRPAELEPGTVSVISVRLNYFDGQSFNPAHQLKQPDRAYISRYALGKDYHKLMRKRLQALAAKIEVHVNAFQYRAFTDSAPVLERALAEKSGLGFTGKNSLIIHPRAGSWFFLGELYTNLPLPADAAFTQQGCGPCNACIQECPTQAIVDNTVVDARRCISYLTIEYQGVIDEALRPLMGNRIYGCDDCQLVCPWNRFTEPTQEDAFKAGKSINYPLDHMDLLSLWQWDEETFLKTLEGSPIRRVGFQQWQRNLAIAIGNIGKQAQPVATERLQQAIEQLESRQSEYTDLVREHVDWAIKQLNNALSSPMMESDTNGIQPDIMRPKHAAKYYLPSQIPKKPARAYRKLNPAKA